jgi:hypothetical protein
LTFMVVPSGRRGGSAAQARLSIGRERGVDTTIGV